MNNHGDEMTTKELDHDTVVNLCYRVNRLLVEKGVKASVSVTKSNEVYNIKTTYLGWYELVWASKPQAEYYMLGLERGIGVAT